jgi:hypothetical protein
MRFIPNLRRTDSPGREYAGAGPRERCARLAGVVPMPGRLGGSAADN